MSEQQKSDLKSNSKSLKELKNKSRILFEQKKSALKSKRREAKQIHKELLATKDRAERRKHKKRAERAQQEISQLESELRAAKDQWAEVALAARPVSQIAGETGTGALPDFVIIGGRKCGTTFLYHLLTLHPFVEPAATKEPHFFGVFFNEGVEWYRQHFPPPRWKDGRRTITGEATPLMANRRAPERMAQVIPQARLIALLRDPVDRTYSDYYQLIKKGREARSFEEAIGLEGASLDDNSEYLSRGVYVDQLQRWHKYFSEEQLLVLKSEDFFEHPVDTFKLVLDFLELPEWEPEASELPQKRRNKGIYEQGMGPETRRRLEEYFEPHNQRLYDYLGVDFGW